MKIVDENGHEWRIVLSSRFNMQREDAESPAVYVQHTVNQHHTVSFSEWAHDIFRRKPFLHVYCTACKMTVPDAVLDKWVQVSKLCIPNE